jgi:hypothetical protein
LAQSLGSHSLGSFTEPGRFIVKVYSNGLPLIFSGATDAGGYFFMPLIPETEQFVAVVTDTTTGETRTVEGIGPETGDFAVMSFNFFDEAEAVETVYWDGEGDGASWHDAFNWNPNTVPGATQKAIIDAPGNITVTHSQGESAVLSLHSEEKLVLSGGILSITQASVISNAFTLGGLYGGVLAGSGELVVGGLFTLATNGTLRGPGRLVAEGGMTLNGGSLTEGYTLVNAGHATWSSGHLYGAGGAVFENLIDATFEIEQDFFFYVGTGGATINNAGTFVKSGGSGTSYLQPTFNNSGTVRAQTGTLLLGAGSSSGVFTGGAGATILFGAGTHILTSASIVDHANVGVTNNATLEVNGSFNANETTVNGTFTLNHAGSTETLHLGAGYLGGSGTLTASGNMTWAGGTLRGAGRLVAAGGIAITGGGSLTEGYTLVNAGHATWAGGNLYTAGGAVFDNRPGATFEMQQDFYFYAGTGGATFNNAGTFVKSGGNGTSYLQPTFNNSGSVAAQSGAVSFGSYSQSATGVLNIRVGGLTPITGFDQFTVAGRATLDGTLNVTLTGGFVPNPGDSFKVMTFASRSGEFATLNGNGRDYAMSYSPTDVTLVAQ